MIILRDKKFAKVKYWRQRYDYYLPDGGKSQPGSCDVTSKGGDKDFHELNKQMNKYIRKKNTKIICRDKKINPNFDTGHIKTVYDPKSKSLFVTGAFWDEGDIVTNQQKSGEYIDRFGKVHSNGNRKMPGSIIIEDTKSAKESYKEFLKHADKGEMNPHFRVAEAAKRHIKNEIRKQTRNANIKKGLAIGAGVALPVAGIAAYKYYKNKKDNDSTKE